MGLIVEDIEVELSSSNIKHYTSLGYIIPKRKNAVGKLTTPRGTKIKVKSFDLQRGSSEFIHIKCDLCGQILTQHYYQYSYRKHEKNICYCNKCSSTMFTSGENSGKWNSTIPLEVRQNGRSKQPGYNNFVRNVMIRDSFKCIVCFRKKTKDNPLDVHHLNGYNWNVSGRLDTHNGVTLCRECHKNFHEIYGKGNNTKQQFEEWYKVKIPNIEKNIITLEPPKIICIETNEIFKSKEYLSEILHVSPYSIWNMCNSYNKFLNNKPFKTKSMKSKHYIWLSDYNNSTYKDIISFLTLCFPKNIKPVHCITTNKYFCTIKSAANFYKINPLSISYCCKNKIRFAGTLNNNINLEWEFTTAMKIINEAYQDKMKNGNL